MSTPQTPGTGHNKGPVIPATVEDLLADLKRRYPEAETKLKEFDEALKSYTQEVDGKFIPLALSLDDRDIAAALQDLLGQMKKQKDIFDAHRKSEKKPWDALPKVVQNFFTTPNDGIDQRLAIWRPVHQAFLDLESAERDRLAREEADRQKKIADDARQAAEEAETKRVAAVQAKERAEREEREAREAAEKAKREKEEADERARLAAEEEARIAKEKRERERAEKAANAELIRELKQAMKAAKRLHDLAEADEANDDEIAALDAAIAPGASISLTLRKLAMSTLLDDEQKQFVFDEQDRVKLMVRASDARFNKREQRKREKARADQEERDRIERERVAKEKADREERERTAREARERAERDSEEAAERARAATQTVRTARDAGREAAGEARTAERAADAHERDAERAGNRADRIEGKIAKGDTDAPLRGDLGTTGSITGRWAYEVVDRAALQMHFGPVDKDGKPLANHLGTYIADEAADAAVYRYMATHRSTWHGERIEGHLPGVVFVWQRDTMIR